MPRINLMDNAPDALKPYITHGIDLQHRSGKDSVGTCLYCDREDKFNVNVNTSTFRCVSCGKGGNQYVFIRDLHAMSMEHTTEQDWMLLAEDRKLLSWGALRDWGICRSVTNNNWLIPGFNADGAIVTLYQYVSNGKRMYLLPTATMGHHLLGRNTYDPNKSVVKLCEGLWDGVALYEMLGQCKQNTTGGLELCNNPSDNMLSETNVLGIPSNMVFNEAWCSLFAGKIVVLMAQNDHERIHEKTNEIVAPASYSGMKRISTMLLAQKAPPEQVLLLKWGERGFNPDLPTGYDVRDLLTA